MRTAEILSKPSALKKIWATFPFICHSYEWAILKNQVQRDDVNEVKKKTMQAWIIINMDETLKTQPSLTNCVKEM